MERFPRHGKTLVVLSLVANLGMLGFFKYCNFFLETVTLTMGYLGVGWQPPHVDVLLPVGISFYTFQTLSYTLDVYRQEIPARRSLLDVALRRILPAIGGGAHCAGQRFPAPDRERGQNQPSCDSRWTFSGALWAVSEDGHVRQCRSIRQRSL